MATKFEVVLTAKLSNSSLSEIRKQISELSKGTKIDIKVDNSYLKSITSEMSSFSNVVKEAKTHTQGLNEIMQKFSSWSIGTSIIRESAKALQDMVQQVFDLDTSLTELDKVTDLTSAGLQNLADDAFKVGEQIGATGKDIIDATTIFAQANYEAKDALDLGEQATMLKNVSEAGATAESSANTLIAAMKAFGLKASDSTHIVDALNEVDIRASRYSNVA